MAKTVYQLKVTLAGSNPEIWRRIVVNPGIWLVSFHRILQTTMGWTNSHLHLFHDGTSEYVPREFETEDTLDSRGVKLKQILNSENPSILYEYDFGDGWAHKIELEKVTDEGDNGKVPRCIEGERACPPEDCGGLPGYDEVRKIISNPAHAEYEETLQWLGGNFDPEQFSLDEVNELLRRKDYGCPWY